jgi:hypothetical protein
MVATHVLDERTATDELSLGQALAGGRASALFAVLAGVSIALMTGRQRPPTGQRRLALSAGLAVRALLIGFVGMLLAELGSGLAIILTYYALAFVLVLPLLGLRPRALLALAAAWVVAAPVLSHLVRPFLPERGFASPSLGQLLLQPGHLLSELLLTGYYPVLPWLAYFLVGMGIGRLDLASRRTASVLAAAGAALAVTATLVSHWLTRLPSVGEALVSDPPAVPGLTPEALLDSVAEGMFGTTPTGGAWQWLLVVTPHSATPFDLAQTLGSALLVIGLALLATGSLGTRAERGVAVLFGAGTMTLTLYSLHATLRSPGLLPTDLVESYLFHVLVLMSIGLVYAAARRRGPLEQVVGAAVETTVRSASGGRRLTP